VTIVVLFLVFWNSKLPSSKPFSCFCNWIKLIADVRLEAAYLYGYWAAAAAVSHHRSGR
jgi:hypothetical protein